MGFDGLFLAGVVYEINNFIDSKLDKISQPGKNEIVLSLRGRSGSVRLSLNANPSSAYMYLTEERKENPSAPPAFCSYLRRMLVGARLVKVQQPFPERICIFSFSCIDDFGETTVRHLIFEAIGRASNIILTDIENHIMICLRRIDPENNPERPIVPGLIYRYPLRQKGQLCLTNLHYETFKSHASNCNSKAAKELPKIIFGLSPLICRVLLQRSNVDANRIMSDVKDFELETLFQALSSLLSDIRKGIYFPVAIYVNGKMQDFSFTKISLPGISHVKYFQSFGALLDEYVFTKDNALSDMRQIELNRKLLSLLKRESRKLEARKLELGQTTKRDTYRMKADILGAFGHTIKPGATSALLPNIYDFEDTTIEIELDPRLSLHQNIQKYYNEYSRLKSANLHLQKLIAKNEEDILYIKSALYDISTADANTMRHIEEELIVSGFISSTQRRKNNKSIPLTYKRYNLEDDFIVFCGRTAKQNEELTFKRASRKDIWLHVREAPGSHCILVCGGKTPTDDILIKAINIAAQNSSLSNLEKVLVDYTFVSNVKRKPGARPGMVTYTQYKSSIATPSSSLEPTTEDTV